MRGVRVLEGRGLHTGRECSVTLRCADDVNAPLLFGAPGDVLAVPDLGVERTDYGVRVRTERHTIETVEHLFAALGGLGVRRGLIIEVAGGEVPIMDGAAAQFCDALRTLDPTAETATLVVTREEEVAVGDARYVFRSAPSTRLSATIEFAARLVGTDTAEWDGTPEAFVTGVAWARTFGFRSQAASLLAAGRALGADATSVMVLDDEGNVEPPGLPARHGEFARHKLLDLVGDLYLFGGPPRGEVHARRPGHGATRLAVQRALETGVLIQAARADWDAF